MSPESNLTPWRPPRGMVGRPLIYTAMAACVALAIIVGMQSVGADPSDDSSLGVSGLAFDSVSTEPSPDLAPIDSAMPPAPPPRPQSRPPRAGTPKPEQPRPTVLRSRAGEAAERGYTAVHEWSEAVLPAGDSTTVQVAVAPGLEYLVLARTVKDCNVDLVITEEIEDRSPSPDAALEFHTSEEFQAEVSVLTFSDTDESCLVGLGVYQR